MQATATKTTAQRMPFSVFLLNYSDSADGYHHAEPLKVCAFIAQGDAISYAIWRAHSVPAGRVHVFEVFKGATKVYRAG